MIKPTAAQQTAIDNNRYKHFVRFTLEGSTLTLGEDEIWEGGFEVSQAVSGQSAFELGACVVNQLKVEIYNPSGRYQTTDFMGKPVYAYIELYDESMTTVIGTISKGHYIVDEANTNGGVIKLTCLDMMTMLDTPYSEVTTAYPATLYNIANGIAQKFGLTLTLDGNTWLPTGISSAYTVTNRPTEDVTCRDVLSAVCQATANYATIDRLGNLFITRYDVDFMAETGSDYTDYDFHDVTPSTLFSFKRDEAQVVISGVSVEVEDAAYTAGTDDYMLHIKDNPMINSGSEQTFATAINGVVNGWNFRPFEADTITNMCMEAGDNILLTDTLGNIYKSVITNTEYSARENQRVECNAESAAVNSSTRYSQAARSAAKAVKNYDSTVNNYIDLVSKGLGMYRSLITDPDDPTQQIYAFHNEETFGDSTFCMFENANGIQVGRRDTTSDPWVYTSASVEDAVVLAQTLVANTAIIDALFSNDVTVTGALHSDDYVPAATGASPPYAQAGMGLDFGEKEFEAENLAIDANGSLYAKSGEIAGWEITPQHLYKSYENVSSDRTYKVEVFLHAPQEAGAFFGRKIVEITKTPNGGEVPETVLAISDNGGVWGSDIRGTFLDIEGDSYLKGVSQINRVYSANNPESLGSLEMNYIATNKNYGEYTPGFRAAKSDASGITADISLGIGTGGVNHGLYSNTLGKWMLYGNATDVYLNGRVSTPNANGYTMDVYGNPVHKSTNNTNSWNICKNSGASVFGVNYETGHVTNSELMTWAGTDITNGKANDTLAFWKSQGTCYALFSKKDMVNGQPGNTWGFLQSFVSGSEIYQIWMAQPNGKMWHRGAHASDTNMPNFSSLDGIMSGTWTPTVGRATKTSSEGVWYQRGGLIVLRGRVVFSGTQTNQGHIYIDQGSLPSIARNVGLIGTGMSGGAMCVLTSNHYTNDNVFISTTTEAATNATSGYIKGQTLRFMLMTETTA